jgi:hypothetical protein
MHRLRRALAALAATAALVALAAFSGGTAAAAPAPTAAPADAAGISWYLWNNGTTNVGAIHVVDSSYAAGPYDGLLAPGERTDVKWGWGQAQAIWLAWPAYPGECASIARKVHGTSTWVYWGMLSPIAYGHGEQVVLPYKDSAGRSYDIQAKRYLYDSGVC